MLNLRLAHPELLIDINPADQRPPSLAVHNSGGLLRLPALTRHRVLLEHDLVRQACPLLTEAVRHVGNVRVRNRGTIGGSLAHADPTSEIGCCALATGAQVVVRGPAEDGQSDRTVPVSDLFAGYWTTTLADSAEIITDVLIPAARPGQGWSFQEMVRRTSDFAIVAVAVMVDLDERTGAIAAARVALAGVADRVVLADQDLLADRTCSAGWPYRERRSRRGRGPDRRTPRPARRRARVGGVPPPPGPGAHRPRAPPGLRPRRGSRLMNKRQIMLTVNGRDHEVWIVPSDTLLDVLHDELGLADVRYGCGEGVCGTCTVLLDGEPVNGCLTLAVQAEGHQVTTMRGLMGPGEALHPLQECFLRRGASQCGFCTPGMILTSLDLVRRSVDQGRGRPSRDEIRYALVGNLCRCTGYTKILDAIEEYADQAAGS